MAQLPPVHHSLSPHESLTSLVFYSLSRRITTSNIVSVACAFSLLMAFTVLGQSSNNMDYSTWATQQFGAAIVADPNKQATVWGENADPDGDGLSNLMEYALGTNPQHFDPMPQPDLQVVIGNNPGHALYDIRHRINDSSLVLVPQVSNDLLVWWPELPTDLSHYTGDSVFFFNAQKDPPTGDGFQHDVFYHQLAAADAQGIFVRLAVVHGSNMATTGTFNGVNVPPTVSTTSGSTAQSSSILMSGYIGSVQVSVGGGASLIVNGTNVGSTANVAAGSVLSLVGTTPSTGQTASYTLAIGSGFSTLWKVSTRAQVDPSSVSGSSSGYTSVSVSVGDSGSANIAIPITAPPGTAGMAPQLGIGYSSQGGNGLLGMGFNLSGLSAITRTGPVAYLDGVKGGVTFGANDRFAMDGQRLILASGAYGAVNSQYHTEMESFTRVTCTTGGDGVSCFTAQTKAGLTLYFGLTANSRVMANRTAGDTAVLMWGISQIWDSSGNYINFTYATPDTSESGHLRIASITYTSNYSYATPVLPPGSDPLPSTASEVDFEYGSRPDVRTSYVAGVKIAMSKRLTAVQCSNGGNISRRYELSYQQAEISGNSQLIQILEKGAKPTASGAVWPAFPPTIFSWDVNNFPDFSLNRSTGITAQPPFDRSPPAQLVMGDFNGDGVMDILKLNDHPGSFSADSHWLAYGSRSGTFTYKAPVPGLDNVQMSSTDGSSRLRTGDFNGDGRTDVLHLYYNGQGNWMAIAQPDGSFQIRQGAQLGDLASIAFQPTFASEILTLDVNGDGRTDVVYLETGKFAVYLSQSDGTFKKVPDPGFGSLRIEERTNYSGWGWVIPGDFNGDGLPDILYLYKQKDNFTPKPHESWLALSNGDGTFTIKEQDQIPGLGGKTFSSDYSFVQSGDFNGDGLTDVVCASFTSGTTAQTWIALSQGDGSFAVTDSPQGLSNVPVSAPSYCNMLVADFNGDGFSDIYFADAQGPSFCWMALGKGDGTFQYLSGNGLGALQNETYSVYPDTRMFTGDFSGEGRDGIAHLRYSAATQNGQQVQNYLARGDGFNSNRIVQVTNGHGGYTKINYKPLTDSTVYTKGTDSVYPNVDMISAMPVVSSLVTRNGVDGDPITVPQNPSFGESTIAYTYERAWACEDGHGFMGFKAVQSIDQTSGITSRAEYGNTDPLLAGRPTLQTQTLGTGQLVSQTATAWTNQLISLASGKQTNFPFATQSVSSQYEINQPAGSAPVKTTTVSGVGYDDFGNLTGSTTDYGNGFTEITVSNYNNDTGHWWLGRLSQTTVTQNSPTGTASRTSTFEYSTGNGQLTKETIVTNNNLTLQKTYVHDGFGNITQSRQTDLGTGASRTITTTYTPDGRFIYQTKNSLGHVETKICDPLTGNVLSRTGPNGLSTIWTYDAFGRPTLETRADGSKTLTQYLLCTPGINGAPPRAVHCVYTQSSGNGPSTVYFDILDRQIRGDASHYNGGTVSTYKIYDTKGEVSSASQAYFTNAGAASALHTDYLYDAISRTTQQTEPGNCVTSTAYNGLTATVTNPLNETFTTVSDVRGRTSSATSFGNETVTNTHDPYGNLVRADDGHGHITTMTYDIRGNKTSMTEPNSGTTLFAYNAFGELVNQMDALGRTVQLSYDGLGRLIQRIEPEGTTVWTYDAAAYGIGKVAKMQRLQDGYSETYQYDWLGRPTLLTYQIGNSTYLTGTAYDEYGRIMESIYPTGFTILNSYTSRGFLNSVSDASTGQMFWTAVTANERGQIAEEAFGNGLSTQRGYDPNTGLINTIQTGPKAGAAVNPTVQNLSYTFNSIGNFTYRQDNNRAIWESFAYDSANRLQTITSNAAASVNVSYDILGNITSKSDVGSYTYGSAAHPHAVTAITGSGTGQNKTLVYDAAGNCTRDGSVALAYNSKNQPTVITQGANTLYFNYSPSGTRYRQIQQNELSQKVRVYIGGLYERFDDGTTVTDTHYIPAASGIVAIKTLAQTGGSSKLNLLYVHKDHLGSIHTLSDSDGQISETQYYDAWGRRRTYDPNTHQYSYGTVTSQTTRGFTGHEMLDIVGLIHMNGRIYDPVVGRFLTADPLVQESENLQNFNRYSYVLNNPLSMTDPSGFFSIGKLLKSFAKIVIDHVFGSIVGAITGTVAFIASGFNPVAFVYGFNFGYGFGSAFTGSLLSGGSIGDALRAGFYGGISAAATYGIGSAFQAGELSQFNAFKPFVHGVVQGGLSVFEGGKFTHGFMSASFASEFSGVSNAAQDVGGVWAGRAVSAVIGGTATVIGGGKFSNGAATGAFIHMFNDEQHPDGPLVQNAKNIFESVGQAVDVSSTGIDMATEGSAGMNAEAAGAFGRSLGGVGVVLGWANTTGTVADAITNPNERVITDAGVSTASTALGTYGFAVGSAPVAAAGASLSLGYTIATETNLMIYVEAGVAYSYSHTIGNGQIQFHELVKDTEWRRGSIGLGR